MLPVIIENMEPDVDNELMSVCNNACWCLGEIALYYKEELAPFLPSIVDRLIPLINHREIPKTLRENVAITLGRLGLVLPSAVAPHLEHFADAWYVSGPEHFRYLDSVFR